MSSKGNFKREQWEALVVESSYWHRAREEDRYINYITFDSEDLRLLDDGLQAEFRRIGGFDIPSSKAYKVDHPLARFYRLMYTDEFEGFRKEVFKDVFGVAGMSLGVQEMLMDQIFRYFVFVKDSPPEARRFGQLICSIAVFRNTFDDESNKFVENGIAKSRRHLFKPQHKITAKRRYELEEREYISLDEEGIPADYEREITGLVRNLLRTPPSIMEESRPETLGDLYTEDLSIYTPLPVNTSVYSPLRKSVLHLMQVIGRYVRSDVETLDIIYTGTLSGNILQAMREVIPSNFKIYPTLDKINAAKPTLIFMDDEFDKESSSGAGDDNIFMQQISLVKALLNTFRTKPNNLLAVSLNFRVPYVLSGPGRFEFLPGTILNTPWKNPQDDRQRLVWTPSMGTELVEYRSRQVVSSRKLTDYVLRSLIRFPTENTSETESMGLVDGEFDSELERLIVNRYYENFPEGQRSWMDIAPDDLVCFPRFIGQESMFGKISELVDLHQFVIQNHVSIPSNPLVNHVSKCARAGIFCTSHLSASPLKEAMAKLFGDGVEVYHMFKTVSKDRSNVILQIREKNIFSRVKDKTVAFNIAKELTPLYKELVSFEPSLGRERYNFVYDLMGSGENRSVVIVQLGDSLGNILYETIENLVHMKIRVKEILYESSFSLSDVWKNVTTESIPLQRMKNAFSLKELLEKARSPFFLIRGYSYPPEIFESVINSLGKMDSYMGYIHVEDEIIFSHPPRRSPTPGKILSGIFSDLYLKELKGSSPNTALFVGSEHELDLSFLSDTSLKRVFHVVESGAGARRVSRLTKQFRGSSHRIFIQENLVTNFFAPLEDVIVPHIIVSHSVFSRIASSRESMTRFLKEMSKMMNSLSILMVLDLEPVWEHMEKYGKRTENLGTVFESQLLSGMVTGSSFQTPHGSGRRFVMGDLESICRENSFQINSYRDNSFHGTVDEPYSMSSDNPSDRLSPYSLTRMISTIIISRESVWNYKAQDEPFSAYEGQAVEVGSQARAYNNIIKRRLIEGVRDHSRVLDLACGHGQDIAKWFSRGDIKVYVGMDASLSAIEEAENRIRTRSGFKPKMIKTIPIDIFGTHNWSFEAEDFLRPKTLFTAISCQLAIHYGFSDDKTIKRFMYNVSRLLELGGEFIVTTIDDTILKRVMERVEEGGDSVHARGQHFHIKMTAEMHKTLLTSPMVVPGVSYEFTQFPSDPRSRTTREYVVDSNYFQQLASDMGLRLLERKNFLQMESSEEIDLDRERSKLEREDREISGFYSYYHFVKVGGVGNSLAEIQPTASLTETERAYQQTLEILSMGTGEKLIPFQRGLFLNPETIFPAPFVDQGYQTMDILTHEISEVKSLYQQLKSRGRLTERENVHLIKTSQREEETYDLIYMGLGGNYEWERYAGRLSENGSIFGTFVSRDTAENVLQGDSEFANSIFEIFIDKLAGKYSINTRLGEDSFRLVEVDSWGREVREGGLELSIIPTESWQQDSKLSPAQKQFFSIFGMFRITRSTPSSAPAQSHIAEPEPEEPTQEGSVDKFVLLPGLVQKKAPGKGREETLASPGSLYKDLAKDQRWRFKLSDDWESAEFPVRMPSGEMFRSVTNAMIYYKCRFADEENKEYLGINLASGLPVPTDMKPFSKAIRGKRGQQWKEQELQIMRSVYEAKFVNTPNAVDEPENLTPLRALLLTRNAHLYSNSKTRNEVLENIRNVLQRIVGI
jgi:SAM-dependent methyltransferase